jgi:hypothetical protein
MLKRIKILLFVLAVFMVNDLTGQPKGYEPEKIEVHLSQESTFAGSILWFKIYCVSALFPVEDLSTLAFIELVSSENTSIIRKKILLNHGEGTGTFEIPADISSGIYYVLGYTNWMKNFGEDAFFRKEIVILNPYKPLDVSIDTLNYIERISPVTRINPVDIKIVTGKKNHSTREKVTLKIESLALNNISGTLSVSVYRKELLLTASTNRSLNRFTFTKPDTVTFLPDYKGIRLSGNLTDLSGKQVSDANVILSFPGPGTDLRNSKTDSYGKFNFLLKPSEGDKDIVITLPDPEAKISLEESFWNGFRNPPDHNKLNLNHGAIEYLQEKFEYYQLQNRFKSQNYVRENHIPEPDSSVFYSGPYQEIDFKNYIILDSLLEYFYELVPSVKFTSRKNEFDISIIDPLNQRYLSERPGVFFDGVLYDDYSEIANVPVSELSLMAVLPAEYYYQDFSFGGIVDIHTKNSDFKTVKLSDNMVRLKYPLADNDDLKFSGPDYSASNGRIPDLRYLLYWEPWLKRASSGGFTFDFFTGDLPGTYIIKVAGISDKGSIFFCETEINVR